MGPYRGERNSGTNNSGKNSGGRNNSGRNNSGTLPPSCLPLRYLPPSYLPPPYFPRNAICPFRVASMLIPRIRPASPGAWKPIEFSASTKSA